VLEERDYVMRAVKQLAEVIGRLLKLALVDPQRARAELDEAARSALGMEPSTLAFVDAHTAAVLLGRADKVVLFATVLEAYGDLDELVGATHAARGRFLHALDLAHEALALDPTSAPAKAVVERLRARLG
jgi:Flp pilus assembly protein TadD